MSLVELFAVVGTKLPLKPDPKYQVQPSPHHYRAINNITIHMPSFSNSSFVDEKDKKNWTLLNKTIYGKNGSLSIGEIIGPKIYLGFERETQRQADLRRRLLLHADSTSFTSFNETVRV